MPRQLGLLFSIAALVVMGASGRASSPQGSGPLKRLNASFKAGLRRSARITKGHDAQIKDHPWQVALLSREIPDNYEGEFCGGCIIAAHWILTAAHCVDQGTIAEQVDLLIGTSSLKSGGRREPVKDIFVHEKWRHSGHDFDFALLRTEADLSAWRIDGLSAVEDSAELRPDVPLTVTGWGALDWTDSEPSPLLQAIQPPVVDTPTCNRRASYNGAVTARMVCAGEALGGPDACEGDSGGPATIVVGGRRKLAGLVSWGDGCGQPKKFGIYARVSAVGGWIRQTTGSAAGW